MRRLLIAGFAASLVAPAYAAKTYTVGVGGEYPDLNAAVAAALADPAAVRDGEQRQDIVFAVTGAGIRATTPQKLAGWRAGAFTTTLRPVAGQGFREYLRAHPDRPLFFDASYGAFLTVDDPAGCLQIDVANATIFGMQISCTGGPGQIGPGFTASPGVLDSSIVLWQGYAHLAPGVTMTAEGGTLRVQNSLIVGTDPRDSMTIAAAGNARIFSYDTILAMAGPATTNQGAGIFSGVHVIMNTAAFNFGSCSGGTGGENNAYDFDPADPGKSSGSNNLTCFPHFRHGEFAHRGQVGASFAREIVGRADWRLAPTALQMRGTGAPAAGGITVDILGRPRNTPDDIGPWAFPGGTPVPDLRRAQQFVIAAGTTTAWTVPAACNGPANAIEALGAGGPGGNGVAGQGPGRGGGGGEYALRYGYPFTAASPGTTIPVSIAGRAAPGRQPGDTAFGDPPFVRAVAGQAGGSGHNAQGGLGGRGGIGMVLHDGGDAGATHGAAGGTGGGGAAGRTGDGAGSGDAAADGSGAGPGTGGGGNDGGTASAPTGNGSRQGTAGGAGTGGRPGGAGGAQGSLAGGAGGPNGGGGGGGTVFWYAAGDGGAGGAGGAGTGFGGGMGPGGGGGGGGGPSEKGLHAGGGGDGGSFGGAGGGAGATPATQSPLAGGRGAPGLIVIRCARAP